LEGREANHTYTEPGEYKVHLMATGLSGLVAEDAFAVHISGYMPTTFDPQNIKRYQPAQ
jgi:alpha-galactosidase